MNAQTVFPNAPTLAKLTDELRAQLDARRDALAKLRKELADVQNAVAQIPEALRGSFAPALRELSDKVERAESAVSRKRAELQCVILVRADKETAHATFSRFVDTVLHRFAKGGDLHDMRGYRFSFEIGYDGVSVMLHDTEAPRVPFGIPDEVRDVLEAI